jgi:hypothetical protein
MKSNNNDTDDDTDSVLKVPLRKAPPPPVPQHRAGEDEADGAVAAKVNSSG